MFELVIVLLIFFISTALSALSLKENRSWLSAVFGVIALLSFSSMVSVLAPQELGWGHVPNKAEKYTKRLEEGVEHQLLYSGKEGAHNIILLVKKTCTSEFKAIRIEGSTPPPEHFALIGGKPVAIPPPSCANVK